MRKWWREASASQRAFILFAGGILVVDMALVILAQTGSIGSQVPAAVGSALFFLSLIAIAIVSQLNRRRELDDAIRRVNEEEGIHSAD